MAAVDVRKRARAVEVYPDRDALMHAAARCFVDAAAAAIHDHGRFIVAVAGGATPKGAYELLAGSSYSVAIDWSRVDVFFGDERCVPPDDPASNYRMTRQVLLDRVPLPAANVHRIQAEIDPARAARSYERELRHAFGTPQGPPRHERGARFDLVLLGLGADGHTASLFPGSAAVTETRRWVKAVQVEAAATRRVTLTPVVINAAAEIAFIVSGSSKSEALYEVIEVPASQPRLPAGMIAPDRGRLRWLVDAEAAAQLAKG